MPTTYSEQFFVIDPANPPAVGSALTVVVATMVDQNDDGVIGTGVGDTYNGSAITSVWIGDVITVNIPGTGNVTITGVTLYVAGQPAVFTPTDGTVLENATFVSSTFVTTSTELPVGTLGPPCFTRGTLIATADGARLIEDLAPGDMILTLDHGPQPLVLLSQAVFPAQGRNAPVCICKGALGNETDLLVSQQHRMLINDWRAEMFFGEKEVLVAAKHLVNGDTVHLLPGGEVEYFHLLFAQHEIVWGAGILSESYFPGHFVTHADRETRAEIDRMFPELGETAAEDWTVARPVVKRFEASLLH